MIVFANVSFAILGSKSRQMTFKATARLYTRCLINGLPSGRAAKSGFGEVTRHGLDQPRA